MTTRKLDSYGGSTELKGQATGWFHLERVGKRDWFVTPEGNAFFPLSLAHLYTCDSRPTISWFYGGEQESWMRDWFECYRGLGFNCSLSGATSSCRNRTSYVDVALAESIFREANFPYAAGIWLIPHPNELPQGQERADVFDPAYAEWAQARVAETCARYRGDPLVLGYYFGFGPFIGVDRWVVHLLALPPGAPGREVLTDAMKERYNDNVHELNQVYQCALTRIDDLRSEEALFFEPVAQRDLGAIADPLARRRREDLDLLARVLARAAFIPACEAVRRHDPNHLIFGPYVKETSFSLETWKELAPYFDVLAPQHSNREVDLGRLRNHTGRPILISDEITGAYVESRTHGVKSFDLKGDLYQQSLNCHLRNPHVSAVSYCATLWDLDEGPMRAHGHLEGVYDQRGQPRQQMIDAIVAANVNIYPQVTRLADESTLADLYAGFFRDYDASRIGATCRP